MIKPPHHQCLSAQYDIPGKFWSGKKGSLYMPLHTIIPSKT